MPIFRNMTEEDIEQVADLERRIFSDPWTSQGIYETFCQNQAFIVVAEQDEKVVGYGIIYCVLDEGEIVRIAVDETVRRQGVGRRILDYACECCKKENVKRLLLDVRESNASARSFYEQYGFLVDGMRKNFYEKPNENAVLMSKELV